MDKMKKRKQFLLIFLLICLISTASGAEIVYWLRGSDLTTIVEGKTHYLMSSSVPTSSSSKTDLGLRTDKGVNELARWYSPPLPRAAIISGVAYLWFKRANITDDGATYSFSLYGFNPATEESKLIVQSAWFPFPKNTRREISAKLESYTISNQHRFKLVIDYNAQKGGGRIDFVVDEAEIIVTTWSSVSGREFTLRGVDRIAALLVDMCSEIECDSNKDCDDRDATTTDKCINPGECGSICRYERCELECFIDYDCDDGSYLTTDKCVGKGTCEAYCSNELCNIACSKGADCDDLNSQTRDVCINPATCLSYCSYEECEPGLCKEGVEGLVCGNGLCEHGEERCPEDCPRELSIALMDVLPGEYFLREETILLKAKIKSNALPVRDATVKAKGFFGEMRLFNDGVHSDGEANDNIYANEIKIANDVEKGAHPVLFEATKGEKKAILWKNYVIIPRLAVDLITDKHSYDIGESMLLNGWVTKKNAPLSTTVNLSIVAGKETIFERSVSSDEMGRFELLYRSSLLYPPGDWILRAGAADGSNNQVIVEKQIPFAIAKIAIPYYLKFLKEPKENYERGQTVDLAVEVRDENGALIEDVAVKTISPSGEVIRLREVTPGMYSGSFKFGWDAPIGKKEYDITALKSVGGAVYGGSISFSPEVKPVEFNILLLEPKKINYQIGDEIPFKIKLEYPNGIVVEESATYATIAGKILPLVKSEEDSIFTASHIVEDDEGGDIILEVSSTDSYGNSGGKSTQFFISGVSINYYLRKYRFSIAVWAIALVIALGVIAIKFARKERLARLKKRKPLLLRKIKQLQKRYFDEGILRRDDYDGLINKYESELNNVRKEIEGIEGKKK